MIGTNVGAMPKHPASLGDGWESKCRNAYARALKACDYECADDDYEACSEWQKIFGSQFHIDWVHHFLTARIGA